jgi:hypothetical protein
MISEYGFVFFDSGSTQTYIFEVSQGAHKYAISYDFLFFGKKYFSLLSNWLDR